MSMLRAMFKPDVREKLWTSTSGYMAGTQGLGVQDLHCTPFLPSHRNRVLGEAEARSHGLGMLRGASMHFCRLCVCKELEASLIAKRSSRIRIPTGTRDKKNSRLKSCSGVSALSHNSSSTSLRSSSFLCCRCYFASSFVMFCKCTKQRRDEDVTRAGLLHFPLRFRAFTEFGMSDLGS